MVTFTKYCMILGTLTVCSAIHAEEGHSVCYIASIIANEYVLELLPKKKTPLNLSSVLVQSELSFFIVMCFNLYRFMTDAFNFVDTEIEIAAESSRQNGVP
jgi:hypothetical protein